MKEKLAVAYLAALVCVSAQTYEKKIATAMERVDRVVAQGPFRAARRRFCRRRMSQ